MTSSVHAIGLGRIIVNSALNQPLNAEISIAAIEEDLFESLEIRLASNSDFRRANIAIEPVVKLLRFDLINGETGPWIHVTTDVPVRSPFLHFLATIEWSGGRIIREYTALLEPPGYDTVAGQSILLPNATDERLLQSGEIYDRVKSGETLMGIATRIDVDKSVSIYQRMFALMHVNSESFIRGNMNLLREGSSLTIPTGKMMAGISRILAREEYARQLSDWVGYRQGIDQGRTKSGHRLWVSFEPNKETIVYKKVPVEKDAVKEVKKSKVLKNKPNTPFDSDVANRGKHILRIVQPIPENQPEIVSKDANLVGNPFDQSDVDAKLEKVRNRLILAEEHLASRELENEQLLRQIALLAEQIDKSAKIISLQDEALALAQKQATLRRQSLVAIASDENSNESRTKVIVETSDSAVQDSILVKTQDASTSEGEIDQPEQSDDDTVLSLTNTGSAAESVGGTTDGAVQDPISGKPQDASTSEGKIDQPKQSSDDSVLSLKNAELAAEAVAETGDETAQASELTKTQGASTSQDAPNLAEHELQSSKDQQLLLILGIAAISGLLITFFIRHGRNQAFQSTSNLNIGGDSRIMTATTQLDLARAYIEMGDTRAARAVLDEVVQQGDANQKANARGLLAKLQIKHG